MNIKKIILATLAYFISSFVIQGLLGFAIGGDYFMSIPIMRENPLFLLSMSSTVLSGIALAILFPLMTIKGTVVQKGLKFGLITGLILVPFIALDLPGRFSIPFEGKWIIFQTLLGFIHTCVAGIFIAFVYGKDQEAA